MRINAAISLHENDIIGQSNQEISNHVTGLLTQEIARQIAVFVRKEMIVNKPGPSMDDPFDTIVQFKIEAELHESNNRQREREYQRMRDIMMDSSPGSISPFAASEAPRYAEAERERLRQLQEQIRWRNIQESDLDDMIQPEEE